MSYMLEWPLRSGRSSMAMDFVTGGGASMVGRTLTRCDIVRKMIAGLNGYPTVCRYVKAC